MSTSDYKHIQHIANRDVATLEEKGKTYGDSWKARGGIGAFMMLARKWDRIENIVRSKGYDIFQAGKENDGNILDDISDLRAYLLLVEDEVVRNGPATALMNAATQRNIAADMNYIRSMQNANPPLYHPLRGDANQPGSAAAGYVKQD